MVDGVVVFCRASPSPVWIVEVGSGALQLVLQWWNSDCQSMVTVARVNLLHSSIIVEQRLTVTAVRRHSDGGC